MSDRQWSQDYKTNLKRHVDLEVTILPNGSSAPSLGEGDAAGAYFTITRNSAGNLTLKTKDAFVAVVNKFISVRAGWLAVFGQATQNADKTWSFPIYTSAQATTVATVPVTGAGSGYTSAPTVGFSGGGGTGAKAHAVLSGGTVASVVVDDPGFGYTSAPTATLSGGGGSGATLGTVTLNTSAAAADIPAGPGIHVELRMRNSNQVP